jgi:hypothetical protein
MGTFKVGGKVVANRDITLKMLFPRSRKAPDSVEIAKGTAGVVTPEDELLRHEQFDLIVTFDSGYLWDVKADWLDPAPAPVERDVWAEVIAALEAEQSQVMSAYENALGDVVWRQYFGGKKYGIAFALRIVRETTGRTA